MSDLSEALLATTGVIRPRPDDTSIGRAAELLAEFTARAGRWVGITDLKHWTPPSSQGFARPESLRERLMHTPAEPEGLSDLGDEVLGAEWVAELGDAREQLLAAWPAVVMRGGIEAEDVPLSFDRGQDWLALVAVVEDPFRLLHELEAGALVPAQLTLFESVYPDLHRVMLEQTGRALVELLAKRRGLSPAKDRLVRLVLGRPPDEPILVPKAEEPAPETPPKSDGPDTRTVAQKAAT
jgi:hypothetical protein